MPADLLDARSVFAEWSEPVEYNRGGGAQTASLRAITKKPPDEVDQENSFPQRMRLLDFYFITPDLIFDNEDEPFEPRSGDEMTLTKNGVEYTYEALPPDRKPTAEWKDDSGVETIVHAKLVVNA